MAGEKVFVSSTWIDNKARRKRVEDAILCAEMVPIGMERFAASTEPTTEECVRLAREADVLVGVIAHRYGWIPPGSDKSITELEYDAADERLMFVLDSSVLVSPGKDFDEGADRWSKQEKLDTFKRRVASRQMPTRFTEDSLGVAVLTALQEWRGRRRLPTAARVPNLVAGI